MKKFLYSFFFFLIFLLVTAAIYLSVIGFETSKFNNLIIKEIKNKDSKFKIELEKIKIKLDIQKIELSLSTNNPKIIYQNIKIPITDIKVYTKINTIINSRIEVSQIIFGVEKFKLQDVQKIAIRIKPSNFKTYLLNNIQGGEIEKASFNLNIDKDFNFIDYKVSGSTKGINVKIKNNFKVNDISFNFRVDDKLTLINSIIASYKGISVSNG